MEPIELQKEIIWIDTDEKSIRYKWEDNANKLNRNIQVVSIEDYDNIRNAGKYLLPKHIDIGMGLIRHPYNPDKYIKLQEAESIIYNEKMHYVSDIVRHLGCQNFKWHLEIIEMSERDYSVKVDAEYKAASIDASVKSKEENKYRNLIKMDESYEAKNDYGMDDYNKAIQTARRYNLYDESDIYTLISKRNPEDNFLTKSLTVSIDLSKEVNNLFDSAFSLNILKNVFSLKTDFIETLKYKKTIKVVMELQF